MTLSLDELSEYRVTTATKTEIPLAESPGSVSVITFQQIQRSSASTIPELLRSEAGVNVRWNPMVQTIDIRSFGSNPFTNRVLLLIDGVPYNSWNKGGFPQHPGFDFFNLDIVKHIEIVRGPGSALYGENAFNGVINIITMDAEDGNSNRASYSTGSQNGKTFAVSASKEFGDSKNLLAAVRLTNGQIPTELWYDESDADAKGYDLFVKGRFERLSLSYYRRQDKFDGFVHEVGGNFPPGTAFQSADEIRQTVNIVSGQYIQPIDAISGQMTSNISFANRDGSHCAGCHAPSEDPQFPKSEDHGYQMFGNVQFDSEAIAHHKITAGAEWRKIDAGSHSHELQEDHHNGTAGVTNVLGYSKHALFLQDQWSMHENSLVVTTGLRYESATSPALFRDQWFPRLSVVYHPSSRLSLRAGWNRAARYPSFSELYQDSAFLIADAPNVDIPLADFIPNSELQPERIESVEFGADLRVLDNLQASLNLFSNRIEDGIHIAYPQIRFENYEADARVEGVELTLRAQPYDWLESTFNWAWQQEQELSNSRSTPGQEIEFTYAPKHKINLDIRITPNPYTSIVLNATWKSETVAPAFWYPIAFGSPEVVPLDSFAYVNLKATYQLPWGNVDGFRPLRVGLSFNNIGNERPFETLSGFGGRNIGRTGALTLEYRWDR